ncbi:MAG TPA: lysophospholipid acyltransferase family protein [Actinomycetes bacterium]|nr:lysophospholipid acyltransferase family protein [Actinomycetes bacterium]
MQRRPRRRSEPRGFWYAAAAILLRPVLFVTTRPQWQGGEHLPAHGGVVVCPNHVSYVDPLTFAHFVYDHGRCARFIAKASLFEIPGLRRLLIGAGQIPVYRESGRAGQALSAAVDAVRAGRCVAVYPEATITRDDDLWPMAGKTGAARIALATGAPVIPVAQWGPQEILPPYAKRPRLFPRHTVHVHAGPPVDLSEFAGRELTAEVLTQATEKIMAAITELLAAIRGQRPPAVRFDPRTSDLPRTGDPRRRGDHGAAR